MMLIIFRKLQVSNKNNYRNKNITVDFYNGHKIGLLLFSICHFLEAFTCRIKFARLL